jgi:hypothetical protein
MPSHCFRAPPPAQVALWTFLNPASWRGGSGGSAPALKRAHASRASGTAAIPGCRKPQGPLAILTVRMKSSADDSPGADAERSPRRPATPLDPGPDPKRGPRRRESPCGGRARRPTASRSATRHLTPAFLPLLSSRAASEFTLSPNIPQDDANLAPRRCGWEAVGGFPGSVAEVPESTAALASELSRESRLNDGWPGRWVRLGK